ncbi:MAG: FkbM family methyltransferase [Planctomycetota bacterium]|jgi:FkbM family methyltransferase
MNDSKKPPPLLTRAARAAAAAMRSYAGRISTRRERVSGVTKLTLVVLFVPPFALMYALLKLHARLYGAVEVEATTGDGARCIVRLPDLVGMYIYLFGIWEPDITRFVCDRLSGDATFIDIGAHIGYYPLLASPRVGGGATIFEALQANLALNRVDNCRIVNMAAAAKAGSLRLYRGPTHNIGLTTTVASRGFPLEAVVEAAPLADMLEPREITTARLVKIDVEAAEDAVLAGLDRFLEQCPRDVEIVVELSPQWWNDARQTPQAVLQPFFDAGFFAYEIENNLWPWRYLWPAAVGRPRRIRRSLERRPKRIDLVLSRVDAEEL